MFTNSARRLAAKQVMAGQYPMRYFGVLPKLPKIELTMRTPYGTFFKDFASFTRVYAGTTKGQIAIGNKTIPRVYLLPPGMLKVAGMYEGAGKLT
jgi:hypothetical protein